jgi:hypothetical protein
MRQSSTKIHFSFLYSVLHYKVHVTVHTKYQKRNKKLEFKMNILPIGFLPRNGCDNHK